MKGLTSLQRNLDFVVLLSGKLLIIVSNIVKLNIIKRLHLLFLMFIHCERTEIGKFSTDIFLYTLHLAFTWEFASKIYKKLSQTKLWLAKYTALQRLLFAGLVEYLFN